jgi:predicted Zn-dependent peptidase
MRHDRLGVKQLSSSKEQLLGHLAMAEESNISYMIMMARNLLDLGRIQSFEEIQQKIKDTTAAQLQQLANEIFIESDLSCLVMIPK